MTFFISLDHCFEKSALFERESICQMSQKRPFLIVHIRWLASDDVKKCEFWTGQKFYSVIMSKSMKNYKFDFQVSYAKTKQKESYACTKSEIWPSIIYQ